MICRITDLVMQLFTLQLHNNCTASAQATPGPAEKKVEHSHAKAQKMTVTPRVLSTAQNNAHVKDQREAGQVDASIIRYLHLSHLVSKLLDSRKFTLMPGNVHSAKMAQSPYSPGL